MAGTQSQSPAAENIPVTKTWSETNVDIIKFVHTWTINYFSLIWEQIKTEALQSCIFSSGSNGNNTKWRLVIRYHKDMFGTECPAMSLNLVSTDRSGVTVEYKLGVLDAGGKEVINRQIETFTPRTDGYLVPGKTILFYTNPNNLPEDKLSAFCEVTMLNNYFNTSKRISPSLFTLPDRQLSTDLAKLFETHQFGDVTILVGEQKFYAHKNILAARSKVFAAMFEHEMKENQENVVEITDIRGELFGKMLRYMYTDQITISEETARHLLAAADKYDLERLKVMCEETLYRTLTLGNAAEMLQIADFCTASQLKMRTIEFIIRHMPQVTETSGWKSISNSKPDLVAEVFHLWSEMTNKTQAKE